ncbi:delta-aminolevulinic acid dehydratase [Desulfurella acetivorans A63]|nr:delta-aminolevulinic acid dehydratase [Desulfurella acetivorans A63]
MNFPKMRPRRLRKNQYIRDLVRQTSLSADDFMYPIFVTYEDHKRPIQSMPGIFQLPLEEAKKEAKEAFDIGIKSVILFGIPQKKDEFGSCAYDENGIIVKAIKEIKDFVPDLIVAADACFCEYTSHGHCGVIDKNGYLLNDETLELLKKEAYVYAKAGADIIAPSGMIDGMVGAIREALDENNFKDTIIMAYSAKYASSFYGPFREAAQSAPAFGDRKSYQMDYANAYEAIKEIELDIEEGADIIMVKPALSYLDIIRMVKDRFFYMPLAGYSVSGEYSLIKAAAQMGWVDEQKIVDEVLTSIKRAGCDIIITYFAKEWIKSNSLLKI